MSRLFRSLVQTPARRPPGRCPRCGRLALEPEARDEGGTPPLPGDPHRCTRCASRYRRRFGGPWEAIGDDDEIVWLDDPVDPLALPPRWKPAHALRAGRRYRRGLSLGRIMLAIAWLAPNLALLARVTRATPPFEVVGLAATLLLFNFLAALFVKTMIELSRGRRITEDWQIVLVCLSPFLVFLPLAGLLLVLASD